MSKTIPKLRFKKFTDNWTVKRLGDLIQIRSGFSPSSFKLGPSGKFPFLKVEELNNSTKYQSESRFFTDERKNIVPRGSVIFPKRGAAILNNKVRISAVDVLLDSNLMAITPLEESLDAEFLYYKIYLDKLYKIADTSTIPQINNKHIEPYKIPLPTLPEQQKIASFLLAVDEKIQQLAGKKELLEQYKKGVMQQLFCLHYDSSDSGDGHDDLPNHGNQKNHSKSQFRQLRFKDENGKAYPKWEEKRLGEVLKIGSGRDYKHLSIGDVPVYGTGGLMTMVNEFLYDGETVCIGRKGTIDKPMYYNGKIWTVDTLFFIYGFKNSIPKFIYFLFQQINWKLYNEASGVPSLSKATIEKLKFEFPRKDEQQKIANFLSAIDTKIESVATQIEKTQTFKKGLLQQMFV